jgi:thioredoxin reductase (NADPH)
MGWFFVFVRRRFQDMMPYDLIIVGGGPAGLAAGIQAKHVGLRTLLVERDRPGGRLASARRVENFPWGGRATHKTGAAIVRGLLAQARRKGLKIRKARGVRIGFREGVFNLVLNKGRLFSRAVIIATGVKPRAIRIPGLRIETTKGKVVGDWRSLPKRLRGKNVFVIGGGEVAFDQACSLAQRRAGVVLVVRGEAPRAFDKLVGEAGRLGVKVLTGTTVNRVAAFRNRLKVTFGKGGREQDEIFDYGLAAAGSIPQRPAVSPKARKQTGQGLYFAGDVCHPRFRQAAIAFGDGVKKAMMAEDYLRRGSFRE